MEKYEVFLKNIPDILAEDIMCFDLEAYTAYIGDDGKTHKFDYSKDKKFYLSHRLVSLVYMWSFTHEGKSCYGRDIDSIKYFLTELTKKCKDKKITVWVHNLSYEYQWLLNCFKFDKTFAVKPRKVIYATTTINDIEITFRCSYFLTRMSLETWGETEKLQVKKMKETFFNYNVPRTPLTPLTHKLIDYSERDVLTMYYGIKKFKDKYGTLYEIPLTQTGIVRRELKKKVKNNRKYHKICTELVPKTVAIYKILTLIFGGGHNHASYLHAGTICLNVRSKDLTSAYPYALVSLKFPMSEWTRCDKSWKTMRESKKYALMLDVTLEDITSKEWVTYISKHKCYSAENCVFDNGRLINGDSVSLYVTDLDLDIIERLYDVKKITVHNGYCSRYDYLPKEFVEFVLEWYEKKNQYKGIENLEDVYLDAKQKLNALFGMAVTSIIHHLFLVIDGKWEPPKPFTDLEIAQKIGELKNKPWKNFLAYQWGVWCTNHIRKLICFTCAELKEDYVYDDTDSAKYMDDTGKYDALFEKINSGIHENNVKSSQHFDIPFEKYAPLDKNGVAREIGLFETEKTADEFVTLGAKRYCCRYGDELKITVSGVNKKKGVKALKGNIKKFNKDLVFDYKTSGKMLIQYHTRQPQVVWHDGYVSKHEFSVTGIPTTYSMDLSKDYSWLLLAMANAKNDSVGFKSAKQLHDEILKLIDEERKNDR